ncbi:MAG: Yip1 family protein [Spirochaetota bacterium]
MIQYLRSLQWVDYFLYVFVEPGRITHVLQVENWRHLFIGLFSVVLVTIIEIITSALVVPQTSFFYYSISYGWILKIFITLICILLYAGLLDILFQYSGFQGSVKKLVAILSIALFPQILLLPSVYIFKTFNFAPLFFNSLFSFLLGLWSLVIAVKCISELHKMDFFRALVLTLLPLVFIGIVAFFIILLLVFLLTGYLV